MKSNHLWEPISPWEILRNIFWDVLWIFHGIVMPGLMTRFIKYFVVHVMGYRYIYITNLIWMNGFVWKRAMLQVIATATSSKETWDETRLGKPCTILKLLMENSCRNEGIFPLCLTREYTEAPRKLGVWGLSKLWPASTNRMWLEAWGHGGSPIKPFDALIVASPDGTGSIHHYFCNFSIS